MTITESPPAASVSSAAPAAQTAGLYNVVTTSDHKAIGRHYIGLSGLFFLLVVVIGVLNGIEKADTGSLSIFTDPTSYFQAVSLYRVGLVFLVVLPLIVGLGTAIVPLQVGSPAIAFPRAASAAFWTWLIGAGVLAISFAVDGGLGSLGDGGTDADAVALTLLGLGLVIVALCLAAVCIATTVIAARAPGLTLRRVPVFSWSMLVASTLWLLTLPALFGDIVLSYVDFDHGRLHWGAAGAINEQVAWAFWQPQIYAYAIVVLGIVAELVPVAARVRQRQYDVLLTGIALFGLLGFGAAFQSFDVQDNFLYPAVGFAVIVPLLIVLGGLGDTLRQGRPSAKGPVGALLLATCAMLLLLAGAVCGALRVLDPLDLLATSATEGVFNLVLLSAAVAGAAGVVYWAAKLFGRLFPEGLARGAAPLFLIGVALVGIPDVISGFLDQPSGIVTTPVKDSVQALNVVSLVGMIVVALAVIVYLFGLARSLAGGPRHAPGNPWDGHTLEWATPSPPPAGNFTEPIPEVRSERPLLDLAETGGAA